MNVILNKGTDNCLLIDKQIKLVEQEAYLEETTKLLN